MAVSGGRVAWGVTAGVGAVILVWLLAERAQETRAQQKRIAAVEEEAESGRRRAAEERVANRKRNEIFCVETGQGAPPVMSPIEGAVRIAAEGQGQKDFGLWIGNVSSAYGFCPALGELESRPAPKDEFERRDRAAERTRLIATCVEQAKEQKTKLPRTYVAGCAVTYVREYDFKEAQFTLGLRDCSLSQDTWTSKAGGEDLVLVDGSSMGLFSGESMRLPVDEARARDFKKRLTDRVSLQLAYEPWSYGPTKYSAIVGFSGRAVAFRLVSGRDILIPWTPFGMDSAGREAPVKVLLDETIAKTKAQALRDRMTEQELKTARDEISKMRSKRRWPREQQDRYVGICVKQAEPSINERFCRCHLEMLMEKYATFGDYTKDLVNTGAKPDEAVAGVTGLCLAAYGD